MRAIGLYSFVSMFSLTVLVASFHTIKWEYGVFALAISGVLLLVSRRAKVCVPHVAVMTIAIGLAIVRISFVPVQMPDTFVSLLDQKQLLQGTIIRLPDQRESNTRITVRVEREGEKISLIAAVPTYPALHVGDRVTVSGTPKKPVPFDTDGGRVFAYDQFLRKDGVFMVMQPAYAVVNGQSINPWLRLLRLLEHGKEYFMTLVGYALPEPESALAAGLIVGGKQGLGKQLLDSFAMSGMLQIVVLSGYNVMIVANAIMYALARFSKRTSAIVACVSIIIFVLAAGAGSSAVRAGAMAVFAVVARLLGKDYDVCRILAVTLFLLVLWNPLMLAFDPGFQFSFLATLGLVIGSPLVLAKLAFIRSAFLRELVATTLAAQAGVLPLLLWQTGNLSLISVFANVLAMPLVPIAMAASAAAALLAIPLHVIGTTVPLLVGLPAYLPLWTIIHIATVSASLPFANIIIPTFSFWYVILSYLFLIGTCAYSYRTPLSPRDSGAFIHANGY